MITFWTFDRWGNQTGTVQDVLEAIHSDELNGEDSLTLTTPTCDLSKGDRIVWRDRFGVWHEHIVNDIRDEHRDGALTSVVYCENSIAEMYTDHIDDVRPTDASASTALGRVLEPTRWAVGTVTVTGTASTTFYHTSAREAIGKVAEVWGGEVWATITVSGTHVTGRAINLGRRGGDYGKRFEWTKDLQGIAREVLTDDVCTALYGYGKGLEAYDEDGELTGGYERRLKFGEINGGLDYVADEDAKLVYGLPDGTGGIKHTFGRVIFEDCEDMEELLALTQAELDIRKHPQVSYTATVIDLADAGFAYEDVRTGDTVAIIDHGLGERLQGRVLRCVRHLAKESATVVTLGNISRSITDELARQLGLLAEVKAHTSAWDAASSNTADYVHAVLNSLNKLMNQTGGYVYMEPGEGIVTYDRAVDDDPTMVVKVTGGGIGLANSKLPNGNWDWKTLITSGHIASELISVVQIIAGYIGNANNGAYWDLDAGVFHLSLGDTLGSSTVGDVLNDVAATITGMEVDVEYAQSQSATTAPTLGWSTTAPAWQSGYYIWSRTKTVTTTASGSTTEYSTPVMISGKDGIDGEDGVGITSIVEEYYLSTSDQSPTDGSWSTSPPTWTAGTYIWTRSVITWATDPATTTTTTPVYDAPLTQANSTAADAAKTATNYLDFSPGGGLDVGYSGTSSRVNVNGSGVDVYDSAGDSAATFGATTRVGKASGKHVEMSSSGIRLYDGSTLLLEARISNGNARIEAMNIIADFIESLSAHITSLRVGPAAGGTYLNCLAAGTIVAAASGTDVTLFNATEAGQRVGYSPVTVSNTIVMVGNGDPAAYSGQVSGYVASDGSIHARLSSSHSGNVRFSYLIVGI